MSLANKHSQEYLPHSDDTAWPIKHLSSVKREDNMYSCAGRPWAVSLSICLEGIPTSCWLCVGDALWAPPQHFPKQRIYLCRLWQVSGVFCLLCAPDTLHNWALFCCYPKSLLISPCKLLEVIGLVLLISQNLAQLLTDWRHPLHVYLINDEIKFHETSDFLQSAQPAQ